MNISVHFANGEEGDVPCYMLDFLIRANKVIAFRRSDGWAQVGQDPMRTAHQPLRRSGNRRDDSLFKLLQP
jgi:hypothetical protein